VAAACCVVPGAVGPESQSFGVIDRPKSLSPVPCGLLSREVGPGTTAAFRGLEWWFEGHLTIPLPVLIY
jgi:hypothetical protein